MVLKNESKECALCQEVNCLACPWMIQEPDSLLPLLESLPRPNGHGQTFPVAYFRAGNKWAVVIYDRDGLYPTEVARGEAATLSHALQLAGDAIAGPSS